MRGAARDPSALRRGPVRLVVAAHGEGDLRFETRALVEQIAFYARLVDGASTLGRRLGNVRVAVTDVTDGRTTETIEAGVLAPLRAQFPAARCHLAPERTTGRGYYETVCLKLYATNEAGDELELADGGDTPWTRALLGDDKERLVISGLGVERLCVA